MGYNVYLRGPIVQPDDHVAFIRKDGALDGVDSNTGAGMTQSNSTANCAQATSGALPTSSTGANNSVTDYGGVVRRECLNTNNNCSSTTCVVHPTSDPHYSAECRYASEFNLLGVHDTVHPDRHPFAQPLAIGAPPASPPWSNNLTDTHYDNGGSPNTGPASTTYDETGTYYLCYRQDRDSSLPGYQQYEFLRYVVVHVHHRP